MYQRKVHRIVTISVSLSIETAVAFIYASRYWLPFQSPGFGNCYTFNSAYNERDTQTRTSSLTGLNNGILMGKCACKIPLTNTHFIFVGLTVELYLDQDNYMLNKLSKKAGARLVVHSAKSPPLPDEFGIDLMPNTASSIAIQIVSEIG